MTAEKLLFQEGAREKGPLRRGCTRGRRRSHPRTMGRTVILDNEFGTLQIGNSGVVVARSIELEDRFGGSVLVALVYSTIYQRPPARDAGTAATPISTKEPGC